MEAHGTLPGPGKYPVPDRHHHRKLIERGWDGRLWTDEAGPVPDGASLTDYRRNPFRFLQGAGWKLFLVFLVATAVSTVVWLGDRHATSLTGVQLLLPVFAGVATLTVMAGLIRLFGRRVGFDTIAPDTRRSILLWGIGAGVVGFAFAMAVELGIPAIFGQSLKNQPGWAVLAGPAEETGKLLLPVILWLSGRFRKPREGFLLVLVAAAAFGVMESAEYGLKPEGWQPGRPFLEVMHPMFTGFIAVVAWPLAWKRGKLFTGAAFGAWVVAMVAHSTNDLVVLDSSATGLLSFISIFAVLIMYLLQKRAARELVPPDRVGQVAPHWRPVSPRHPISGECIAGDAATELSGSTPT